MFIINKGNISMTRGDDGYFSLAIYCPNNQLYEPKRGDKVTFFLMTNPIGDPNSTLVLRKVFEDGKTIKLEKDDTKFLAAGRYYYRCVIDIARTGDRNTVCDGVLELNY